MFLYRSGEDITTTHCEAYELANLSHEYEDVSEYQNTEYMRSVSHSALPMCLPESLESEGHCAGASIYLW